MRESASAAAPSASAISAPSSHRRRPLTDGHRAAAQPTVTSINSPTSLGPLKIPENLTTSSAPLFSVGTTQVMLLGSTTVDNATIATTIPHPVSRLTSTAGISSGSLTLDAMTVNASKIITELSSRPAENSGASEYDTVTADHRKYAV